MISAERNIVLIGMPGVGKSTVGVLLAKATSRNFLDTDVWIQSREGRTLQEILEREGSEAFCAREERHVLALDCRAHVIATGGSVVYGERAMEHLRRVGIVVHLDLELALLRERLRNLAVRGVVIAVDQTLEQLWEEREPLYRRWADVAIAVGDLNQDQVVARVLQELRGIG